MGKILNAMGYENWSNKNALVREKKSAVLGTSEALGNFSYIWDMASATTAAGALALYDKSTAVSVPVNRIATAISNMDFVLQMEDGSIIGRHPVLDLMRSPSPYYDNYLFFEMVAKNYMITGESEIVAIGGITRPPIELQPISPDKVTVIEGSINGLPASHLITGNTMAGAYAATRDGRRIRYIRDGFTETYREHRIL